MKHQEYCASIRRDGAALVAAARAAGVDADVPACPGWKVADLLAHIGRIHEWVADIVTTGEDPKAHWSKIEPPVGDALIDYEDTNYQRLAAALEAAGPAKELWTWTPDKTTGFWARRQANEMSVHRWDMQGAAGTPEPITPRELACDGIQEVFDILPARPRHEPITGNGETIHLHCTDGEGEWLIKLTPEGVVCTNEHAKGDVAARGSASDLLLLMWGRIGTDATGIEIFGDATLIDRWQGLARF